MVSAQLPIKMADRQRRICSIKQVCMKRRRLLKYWAACIGATSKPFSMSATARDCNITYEGVAKIGYFRSTIKMIMFSRVALTLTNVIDIPKDTFQSGDRLSSKGLQLVDETFIIKWHTLVDSMTKVTWYVSWFLS